MNCFQIPPETFLNPLHELVRVKEFLGFLVNVKESLYVLSRFPIPVVAWGGGLGEGRGGEGRGREEGEIGRAHV